MFCHQAHAVAGRPADCRIPHPEWPVDPMITTTTQNGRTLADLTTHTGGPGVRPTEVVSEADRLAYTWLVRCGKATGTDRSNSGGRRFAMRLSQGRASHLDAARPDQSTSPRLRRSRETHAEEAHSEPVSRLRRSRTRSCAGKASVRPASSPVRCCSASAATAARVR